MGFRRLCTERAATIKRIFKRHFNHECIDRGYVGGLYCLWTTCGEPGNYGGFSVWKSWCRACGEKNHV
jgi:hypothetical protein